jgi:uncharacterized protein YbjT (DUF2867 family)
MVILVFGASGSAGGSVLRACLSAPLVKEVRAITRRPLALTDPKLRVSVHGDYGDYRGVEAAFVDVDACLFCLGISVRQVSSEAEYRRITHDFAIAAAGALRAHSPRAAFHFISGTGTSVDSRFMWARVKGATERELIDLVGAVCWRPAAIDGVASASEPLLYKALRPMYRVLKPFRSLYVAGEDIGRAMMQATVEGMRGRVIENAEIRDIADRAAGRDAATI